MQPRIPTLERCFQLARSGACAGPADIRARMIAEGYRDAGAHLAGPALRRQLREVCERAGAALAGQGA